MLGSLWERGKLKLAVDSATSTADEPTPSEPAAPQPLAPAPPAVNLPWLRVWVLHPHHAHALPLPTAVYVLDELVQELGAGDSRAGVDAVCARLAHRSPVVKQKVGGRNCLFAAAVGSRNVSSASNLTCSFLAPCLSRPAPSLRSLVRTPPGLPASQHS